MLPSTWGLFDAMLLRSVTMLADCTFSELLWQLKREELNLCHIGLKYCFLYSGYGLPRN
jgi:phosphoribosyl-AMP cyclohydrolase